MGKFAAVDSSQSAVRNFWLMLFFNELGMVL
jgi:hypothetical protein